MYFIKKICLMITIVIVSTWIIPVSVFAESNASSDLNEVFELLQSLHISGVDESQLSSDAIDGMIEALDDPHTEYFTEEEWSGFQNTLNQNYVGVGMRLGEDEQGVYVVEVFPDSPAEAGEIVSGDYIIGVGGQTADDLNMEELINLIVGPEGTAVSIKIMRLDMIINLELTRAQIQIPVVTSKWFTEEVGYIRLSGFSENADQKFAEAMAAMKEKKAKGLIIDLRGNPGGYLHVAKNIAAEFIDQGILINARDRNAVNHPTVIENGKSVAVPVVLLVDRNSASASEILAGALQDYDLATIIGTTTYGKGSVQSLRPLSSGGYLKVTVEEYLTPEFNSVNHVGIQPHIEVYGSAAQMITALHTLGVHDIELLADKRSLRINQISVIDSMEYVQENGKNYVSSRVLAALIDGTIEWNSEKKAVEITKGENTGTFLVSSDHVKLISGTSFVELDAFQNIFSDFSWSSKGEVLQLSSKQGNGLNE